MSLEGGRRRKQLLKDLKKRRGYWKLKEEALDCTVWRTRFGRGYGPVAREAAEYINISHRHRQYFSQTHKIFLQTHKIFLQAQTIFLTDTDNISQTQTIFLTDTDNISHRHRQYFSRHRQYFSQTQTIFLTRALQSQRLPSPIYTNWHAWISVQKLQECLLSVSIQNFK
jgi:hypothetical protein